MAAGVTIKLKRKAGAFSGGELVAGEVGVDTTNGVVYFSLDGSTVQRIFDKVIQIVHTADATQKSTTAAFPQDDTIPQSGEGTAYSELDTTITPKFSSSKLLVQVNLALFMGSINMRAQCALFRDSGASALHTADVYAEQSEQILMIHSASAGSTSATTFKVRFGRSSSNTLYLNDFSTPLFGGTVNSTMTIFEIAG